MKTVIAVDGMGGDHGPAVIVPACLDFLASNAEAELLLVGLKEPLERELARAHSPHKPRITIVAATEVVGMDEDVRSAIRTKKNSSMRVAIDLVKEGRAQACVSAGNTGALMGTAKFVLKTLPGIDRPAICAILPTRTGQVYALDLGANADCTPENLQQFAIMGATLVRAVEGKANPTVGLLNIGSEDIKGSEVVKKAGELLRNTPINFHGNVEGDDIYKGTTDVVVCDGFVGNVALKTSEGLAKMLGDFLKEEFTRSWSTKLLALFAYPVIRRFRNRVDHRRYNGAALLGLKGIVVKSHGSADRLAFSTALQRAATEASHGLIERIGEEIARLNAIGSVRAGDSGHGSRGMTFARITGTGGYLPEKVLTNKDLESLVETSDDWIVARTGIRQRHIAAEGQFTSDLALEACRNALTAAGRTADDVDLIIVATSTPDMVFPSSACLLQAKLGVTRGAAFDIQAVCTGFTYALSTADLYIRSGRHRCALVVGAEVFSRILDWNDRGTCVLFGDGAGAVVLEASQEAGIIAADLHADGRHAGILNTPGHVDHGKVQGDPTLKMDGQAVFKLAVRVLEESARSILAANGMGVEDLDAYIAHQANVRILAHVAKKLGLPDSKCIVTVDRHANTSAASVPLALDVAVREGRIKAGDNVLLQGVGGGFTWGSVLLKY